MKTTGLYPRVHIDRGPGGCGQSGGWGVLAEGADKAIKAIGAARQQARATAWGR